LHDLRSYHQIGRCRAEETRLRRLLGRLCFDETPAEPFGSAQTVLDYLGRYIHRVALSNDRILQVQDGEVTLSYRDRRDGDRKKTITLEAQEFICRFLPHVLPRLHAYPSLRLFGPTDLRNKPWADAANSSISIRCCRHLPFSQPRICCLRSSASIFLAARAAVRER